MSSCGSERGGGENLLGRIEEEPVRTSFARFLRRLEQLPALLYTILDLRRSRDDLLAALSQLPA